jgi:hypothetical protein
MKQYLYQVIVYKFKPNRLGGRECGVIIGCPDTNKIIYKIDQETALGICEDPEGLSAWFEFIKKELTGPFIEPTTGENVRAEMVMWTLRERCRCSNIISTTDPLGIQFNKDDIGIDAVLQSEYEYWVEYKERRRK